jgi:hypothetical protein
MTSYRLAHLNEAARAVDASREADEVVVAKCL